MKDSAYNGLARLDNEVHCFLKLPPPLPFPLSSNLNSNKHCDMQAVSAVDITVLLASSYCILYNPVYG